jgi:transcriptional regulator with XRE-family HTH domain
MKQRELAQRANLSPTFVSEVETGRRSVGSDSLLRIAEALGASLDYLMRGDPQTHEPVPPTTFPPELVEAATEENWPTPHMVDLLRVRQIVVARRSRSEQQARALTIEEWKDLYRQLRLSDDPAR